MGRQGREDGQGQAYLQQREGHAGDERLRGRAKGGSIEAAARVTGQGVTRPVVRCGRSEVDSTGRSTLSNVVEWVLHREKDRDAWLSSLVQFSVGGFEYPFTRSAGTVGEARTSVLTDRRQTYEALGPSERR
jgi:hypothetical protein